MWCYFVWPHPLPLRTERRSGCVSNLHRPPSINCAVSCIPKRFLLDPGSDDFHKAPASLFSNLGRKYSSWDKKMTLQSHQILCFLSILHSFLPSPVLSFPSLPSGFFVAPSFVECLFLKSINAKVWKETAAPWRCLLFFRHDTVQTSADMIRYFQHHSIRWFSFQKICKEHGCGCNI